MDEVRREGRVDPETLAVLHRSETELDEMGAGAGGGGGSALYKSSRERLRRKNDGRRRED